MPLIFAGPGIRSGLRSEALVELVDLSATLLELAGVEPPEEMQGRSLMPILTGAADPQRHREFVHCEYYDALDPAFVPGYHSYGTMYRDERYKLVTYHDQHLGELYDLRNDPWEFENLWDDPAHKDVRMELLQRSFDATMLYTVDVGTPRIAPM